jgi:endoglucanase
VSARVTLRSRSTAVAAVAALAISGVAASGSPALGGPPSVTGLVRVDQVGYAPNESKQAFLLATGAAPGAAFAVQDEHGKTVFTGHVNASRGGWNAKYPAVHPIDFTGLHRPGTYRISVTGAATAASPRFRIARADALFDPLARDTTKFFQIQRDGAHQVPGPLDRKPSHLTDRRATVYDHPVFAGDGGDTPAAPLKEIGGPVDLEGGWFDAGDFVKFTHAAAYSLAELLLVQRTQGSADRALDAETRHGLDWLDKAWDDQRKVLYVQVGIGTGSEEFGFLGDHDVWRLPEADDALQVKKGDPAYFIKYRPAFRSGPPGSRISPNLAGRVAASFALAAQTEAWRNPKLARHYLESAASVFALAKTENVGELLTAFPHAYYPEDSWQDDLEFGATELATAGRILGDRRTASWLKAATHWAKAYVASPTRGTLNLYDTGALGHTDLVRLLRVSRTVPGLEITEAALLGDLRRQLDAGVTEASKSPFRTAAKVTDFDAATRSFGFAATARLYRSVTGDNHYEAFGTRQRNFTLGANAWGTSLVVGEGTVFPHCPQHQVANLSGSLTGGRKVIVGAVVNGPNGADNFDDLGTIPDGGKDCPGTGTNPFAPFDRTDSRYLDDVASWPSVEPAIDFTSTGMLAFALSSRG